MGTVYGQGRGKEKRKGKIRVLKTQGFDPGFEVTQFGLEGWCVLLTFEKTLGGSHGDWWVSGTAQVMESSPTRLQRRTEKREREGFKEGC